MKAKSLIAFWLLSLIACQPGSRGHQILFLAMEDDIITLDPHLHDDSVTHSVLSNIFEPLVTFDPQMRIVPALAVSWENPDDLTWRFHLRPGVKFHSGAGCRAADVAYSLERAKNTEVGHYLSQISRMTVLDSLTVELRTEKPLPILLNKLTFVAVVPQGCEKPLTKPVGTGPYAFENYRKGEILEIKANPDYWGGRPAIAMAVFKVLPEDGERLQALLKGEIMLARDMEGESKKRIASNPALRYVSRPGLGVSHLGINVAARGPLADRRVRQAIFWALDPAEIIGNSGLEAEPCDQLISPYIVGYLPAAEIRRPNPEKARELLRQAGYSRGFKTTLEMSASAAASSGPTIVKQLEKIGIRVELVPQEWTGFTQRLKRRESPFYLIGWSCSSGDASDLYDACLHTRTKAGYGNANHTGYSNRQVDRLIEQSNQTLNSKERIEILHRIQALIMEDMPLVPLYIRNRSYGVHRGISFTPRQDARVRLMEISWAKKPIL
jgi:peptide/nickel transport system substrate-binding protein